MLHQRHVDCFVFCDRSLQRRHQFAAVLIFFIRGLQCARHDPFPHDNTICSTRIQGILCILAVVRTLALMLSPPVSLLSVARNHRPLPSARPWGLPDWKFSDRCQVTRDSPLVCEWPEHASVSRFLFVLPTLSARMCGNSVITLGFRRQTSRDSTATNFSDAPQHLIGDARNMVEHNLADDTKHGNSNFKFYVNAETQSRETEQRQPKH